MTEVLDGRQRGNIVESKVLRKSGIKAVIHFIARCQSHEYEEAHELMNDEKEGVTLPSK